MYRNAMRGERGQAEKCSVRTRDQAEQAKCSTAKEQGQAEQKCIISGQYGDGDIDQARADHNVRADMLPINGQTEQTSSGRAEQPHNHIDRMCLENGRDQTEHPRSKERAEQSTIVERIFEKSGDQAGHACIDKRSGLQ